MLKYLKIFPFVLMGLIAVTCNRNDKKQETILKGQTTILVDETIKPIVEDQVEIFESQYDAEIALVSKSETEVVQALLSDSARIAVMTRGLTAEEAKVFKNKKITPKITKFAIDAIALISNRNDNDTLIALQDVIDFMHGKPSKIKGLVFDNPNSSTARYINELAQIEEFLKEGVYSFGTNEDAIRYVSENNGLIGVVGLNWISQPTSQMKPIVEKINVLSVRSTNGSQYVYPSQNEIGMGRYPLARDLYIVNCQGFSGLGMGFSSFIAGEVGQRIILKSGLVPARMPARIITTRTGITNDKK